MKKFKLINAKNIEEAVEAINDCNGKVKVMSGGTDLLGGMKREIHPDYTDVVVNLQNIPDMEYIKEEDGFLKIGALTKLKDIEINELVKEKYTALAEAARRTASPTLRRMGTIGGNICQENRCWYYRAKENYFPCKMKGGKKCYAPLGDNRYHSIFGGIQGCMAVNPSDTAPALMALNAKIVTNKRTIDIDDFWAVSIENCTCLEKDEIVVEIQISEPSKGTKSWFIKDATRGSIDFPIVNCAAMVSEDDVRICLNAVYPTPYRSKAAEDAIKGKVITEETAEKAGEVAVANAKPLSKNKAKVQMAKILVKRSLLACK